MTVSSERRIATGKNLYQVAPIANYNAGKEEISLCDLVVRRFDTIPIFFANTANKTVRIPKTEKLVIPYLLKGEMDKKYVKEREVIK